MNNSRTFWFLGIGGLVGALLDLLAGSGVVALMLSFAILAYVIATTRARAAVRSKGLREVFELVQSDEFHDRLEQMQCRRGGRDRKG